MKPLVSVIIPNYNYAEYLREAIDSVLNQTYPNIEIVVVDDGSKDHSAEVLKSYKDRITAVFQENAGVSAARNNGAERGRGRYIAFLDADDYWLPEKVARQVEVFEGDQSLGLVHVGVDEIGPDQEVLKTRLEGQSGRVSHEFLLFERAVVLGGGSGAMVRREVFEEVGGFDLRLLTSADWDLYYRISRRYPIGFVPEVLLKYRVHGSNMHADVRRMEREMMLGFEKAFSEDDDGIQKLKRASYGNLHQVLAGSYFRKRQYGDFFRHALKSIWLVPRNLVYFAGFPFRRLGRTKL
ncbi:MAG: glycosyltransferase [Pyrinomonadaceae bacterium]